MEPKLNITAIGQQLTMDDVNLLGDTAALADDRVLAELLRMAPFDGTTVSRGIIPGNVSVTFGQVYSGTGGVNVGPFRAVIGSRTALAGDAKANWRDIRSAICVGNGANSRTPVALAANASGNPRWDLVYAAVSIDANANTVTRKIKNPTTKVIAGATVSTQLATTVTLGAVTGTPAASPVWPAAPSDAGGTYYIPLAYILVDNGFNSASVPVSGKIFNVANYLGTAPIEGSSLSIGTINLFRNMNTATQQAVGAGGGTTRNLTAAIPSGTESVLLFLDLTTAGGNIPSSGTIVDSSRNWSNRYFRWTVMGAEAYTSTTNGYPQNNGASTNFVSSNVGGVNLAVAGSSNSSRVAVGMGSSFGTVLTTVMLLVNPNNATGPTLSVVAAGTTVGLSVDASGNLVCTYTGSPNCQLLVWLDATSRVGR